jgi:hypothetical protein
MIMWFMQNFSSLACTRTDFDKFSTWWWFSSRKFWNFQIWKRFWIEIPKRHLLTNFEPSSIFWKFSKLFSNFFDSWVFKRFSKFQNSEYEVHQVGSNEACSKNFSFLALSTAELAAPQISSKNPLDRRDRRKFFFALNAFFSVSKVLKREKKNCKWNHNAK